MDEEQKEPKTSKVSAVSLQYSKKVQPKPLLGKRTIRVEVNIDKIGKGEKEL